MALECARCGSAENVDAVCHHCGRPLCQNLENCRAEIEDCAFASRPDEPVVAVHCHDCWQDYHAEARVPGAGRMR